MGFNAPTEKELFQTIIFCLRADATVFDDILINRNDDQKADLESIHNKGMTERYFLVAPFANQSCTGPGVLRRFPFHSHLRTTVRQGQYAGQ